MQGDGGQANLDAPQELDEVHLGDDGQDVIESDEDREPDEPQQPFSLEHFGSFAADVQSRLKDLVQKTRKLLMMHGLR